MARTNLTEIKTETAGIKAATDKIADVETKVGEIANGIKDIPSIKTEVGNIATKIKELEELVGKQDPNSDHNKDTGIYKVIHDNFTELMGS